MDDQNIIVDTCPICKEGINKDELFVTECNHKFHKNCFSDWKTNNDTCPLCRTKLNILDLDFMDTDYKFYLNKQNNKYYFKDIYIFEKIYCKILHSKPKKWINIYLDFNETKNLAPLYEIESLNGRKYFIDSFLRQALLFYDYDELKVLKISDKKFTFYTSSESFSSLNRNTYNIVIDWFYEVMMLLQKKYYFIYLTSMNPLFLDIFTLTLKLTHKFNKRDLYQTVILSSIYNIIKFYYNKELDKNFLIELSDNSSKMVTLEEIISYQNENIVHKSLKKNLI